MEDLKLRLTTTVATNTTWKVVPALVVVLPSQKKLLLSLLAKKLQLKSQRLKKLQQKKRLLNSFGRPDSTEDEGSAIPAGSRLFLWPLVEIKISAS